MGKPISPFCSAGPERSRSLIMERWPSRSRRKSDPSEFEKSISTRKLHSAVQWSGQFYYYIQNRNLKIEQIAKAPNNPFLCSLTVSRIYEKQMWSIITVTDCSWLFFFLDFLKDLFANFSNAIHFWKGRHSCKFFKLDGTKIRQKSSAELIGVLSSRCFCPQYIRTVSS